MVQLINVTITRAEKYLEIWERAIYLGGRIHNCPQTTEDDALIYFGSRHVQLEFEVTEEESEDFERVLRNEFGEFITISTIRGAAPLIT